MTTNDPVKDLNLALDDGHLGAALLYELRIISQKPGKTLDLGGMVFTGLGNNQFEIGGDGIEPSVWELPEVQL